MVGIGNFGVAICPRHRTVILLAAPLLWGCGGGTQSIHQAVQRDSAGIVIVENPAEMALDAGGWGLDPEPFLSIGSIDGDGATALYGVIGAHRLSDGGVAIVNSGTKEIRVFDGSGSFIGAFGREGDGPGDFRAMHMGGVVGKDTLVVLDVTKRQISLISPAEGFLGSAIVEDSVSSWVVPSGVFSDGRIVFGRGNRIVSNEDVELGPARIPSNYRTCDLQGRFAGSLGLKPGPEVVLDIEQRDGKPFVRQGRWPLGKDSHATVSSNRLYFGSQDTFEIEAVDPEGVIRTLVRVMEDPHPVTPEAWDLYVDEDIHRIPRDEENERRRRRFWQDAEQYRPATFPAHGLLKADALDHLWVEEYRMVGEETHIWSVFDPKGARLARVTLPRPMEILEIGEYYLLGMVRDELDVEYVRLYHLRRGA